MDDLEIRTDITLNLELGLPTMRIVSINLNGINNAVNNGFSEWLASQDADVICVQDLQASPEILENDTICPAHYESYFFPANDGVGGTGIYCKQAPKAVITGIGSPNTDAHGRFIQVDFDKVSIASVLFPEGSTSDEDKQQQKRLFMQDFMSHLKRTRRKRREFIFCGTYFIAHKTIDVSDWQSQQNQIGFLPEERAWLDQILGPVGFIDAFREVCSDDQQFSWWPDKDHARRNTEGLRIDYQLITPNLRPHIKQAEIVKDQLFSQHAPIEIEYEHLPL